jgi:hypothetical protein
VPRFLRRPAVRRLVYELLELAEMAGVIVIAISVLVFVTSLPWVAAIPAAAAVGVRLHRINSRTDPAPPDVSRS